jgi:hypothetical protein
MEDQKLEAMLDENQTPNHDTVEDVETAQAAPEEEVSEQEEAKPSDQERNFAALRTAREQAERERDEAIRYIQQLQQQVNQKSQSKEEIRAEKEDDLGFSDDDLVEGKHLRNYYKEIKALKQEIKEFRQKSAEQTTEALLKSKYPDFDAVVSSQNLKELRSNYPELAETINNSSDLYNKAVSAYTIIKKMGLNTPDEYIQEKQRAAKNTTKPKPLNAVSPQQGDSPLSHANAFANGLTEDLKKQLLKEMTEAAKGQ